MLFKDKKAFLFLRLNGVKQRRFFCFIQIYFFNARTGRKGVCGMMIHMTTVGGVTADIEGKESANGATYLSFDLAVTKGYGL